MARTKEEINAASVKRMRKWRAKQKGIEVERHEPVCRKNGTGMIYDRGSISTVGDLEELFGRKLYRWEIDLWVIAGWTGSRRFLNIQRDSTPLNVINGKFV